MNKHTFCKHYANYCMYTKNYVNEFIREDVAEVSHEPTPYDPEWEMGYLAGSGENIYDDSYIDYLNRY